MEVTVPVVSGSRRHLHGVRAPGVILGAGGAVDETRATDAVGRGAAVVAAFLVGGGSTAYGLALVPEGPDAWPVALAIGGPGAALLVAGLLFHRRVRGGPAALLVAAVGAVALWALLCHGTFAGWGD